MSKMNYFYSFFWIILIFAIVGPICGMIFVTVSGESPSSPGETGLILFWGYVFGIIPAVIAGFINWLLILIFHLAKNDNYFWPSAFLSGASPSVMFYLFSGSHLDFSWLIFSICMFATIICAFLSSNRAWQYLCNS